MSSRALLAHSRASQFALEVTVNPRPLRAVIYVRLSVHRGKQDPSVSPAAQEERCRAYCASKGWDVLDVVQDLDVSGSDKGLRLDRPGLRRVRELLPDVDVVIFAKLDRLARSVSDFHAFAAEAETHDATLVSVAESLDLTTPGGRFFATILAAFAEMEAATISDRVRNARAALVKARRWSGGTPPIGYTPAENPDGPGWILVPHPIAAPVLRDAAAQIVAGASIYTAVKAMNASGVGPPRAASWSIQALSQALTGHAIIGRATVQGEVLRDDSTGEPIQMWEPVFPYDLWRELRDTLRDRKAKRTPVGQRTTSRSRLLSGIASCAACGGPLYVRPGGKDRATIYACGARSNGRPCPGTAVTAERLEEHVAAAFLGLFTRWPVTAPREVEAPALALAEVEEAIAATTDAMRARGADRAALAAQLDALDARREALLAASARPAEVEYVDTGETIGEVWDRGDTLTRRDLLTSAIEYVAVSKGRRGAHGLDPARVDIGWRFDDTAADPA